MHKPYRSTLIRYVFIAGGLFAFATFAALGTWQVKRLQWKQALIERVEQRVHAQAIAAPSRERWPQINAASDEYRHVYAKGIFLYDLTTRVQASTALGSGFWLLTPLRSADGSVTLINRGFIPANKMPHDAIRGIQTKTPTTTFNTQDSTALTSQPSIVVTGLLRMSEPGGAFLRNNDAANNRWYSRDVQAIAAAHHLSEVAPYFIDADKTLASKENAPTQTAYPIGGLTVIHFSNNHLVYALTWYALALMVAIIGIWVARNERRLRHDDNNTNLP